MFLSVAFKFIDIVRILLSVTHQDGWVVWDSFILTFGYLFGSTDIDQNKNHWFKTIIGLQLKNFKTSLIGNILVVAANTFICMALNLNYKIFIFLYMICTNLTSKLINLK